MLRTGQCDGKPTDTMPLGRQTAHSVMGILHESYFGDGRVWGADMGETPSATIGTK